MGNILITAAIIYVTLVAGLYVFQRHLLYHPAKEVPRQSRSGVPEMASHRIVTADGVELLAWYASARDGWPTILYFHGNAGHIGERGFKVRPFLDAGYGVMLVEYRGYGGNPGTPSEEGLYADARAGWAFLRSRAVSADRVVLYGESLGSGIAVQLGAELAVEGTPVGAIVLEAPFSSIPDVAASHYPYVPVRYLVRDRFDSLSKIGGVAAPLLIVHGGRDRTVPERFGRKLFDTAKEPKEGFWISRGAHNDLPEFGLFQGVNDFLTRRMVVPAASPRG